MIRKTAVIVFLMIFVISCKEQEKERSKSADNSIQPRTLTDIMLAAGTLQRIDSFPSAFIVPRTVDVWLPEGYENRREYRVLYMHDGQNLFDANTTWNNQEMKVDELASELMKKDSIHDMIVVAIHNIPKLRFLDYFPEKAFDYLNQELKDSLLADGKKQGLKLTFDDFKADEYLKFITQELKPYIDSTYATLSEQQYTFIAGASMGGLISMYAMCEYPSIFSGAACISTHWPGMNPSKEKNSVSKSIFKYMEAKLPSPENHSFYFDYGTETLDAFYPKYLEDVDEIFNAKGYTSNEYMNLEFEGADHSENSWNRRFDIPLIYLLKK